MHQTWPYSEAECKIFDFKILSGSSRITENKKIYSRKAKSSKPLASSIGVVKSCMAQGRENEGESRIYVVYYSCKSSLIYAV